MIVKSAELSLTESGSCD